MDRQRPAQLLRRAATRAAEREDAEGRQLKREKDALDGGYEKYLKRVAKSHLKGIDRAPLRTRPGREVFDEAVRTLAEKIQSVDPKKMGKNATVIGRVMLALPPHKLAYITVHTAANAVLRRLRREDDEEEETTEDRTPVGSLSKASKEIEPPSLATVSKELGKAVVQAMGARRLADGSATFCWVLDELTVRWQAYDQLRFAACLLQMLADTGAFIDELKKPAGQNKPKPVMLLDAVWKQLDEAHEKEAWLSPRLTPMVVPPRPWTSASDGGYLSPELQQPLIRGPWDVEHQPAVAAENARSDHVRYCINVLQKTSWRINQAVLERAESEGAFKGNELLRQMREVARECAQHPAIYFVWRADYRGRMYPDSDALNIMQGDLARGLLEFAPAVALGKHGRRWLAIHIANCYGRDPEHGDPECGKLAMLDERAAWTERNGAELLSFMDAPDEKSRPKERWQFYAAALVWQALLEHEKQGGKPETFKAHVPVMLDGRANGIQHLSALILSLREGKLVGLVPSERPEDLYSKIAHDLREKLAEKGFASNTGIAQALIDAEIATRDFVKLIMQPCVYGSTPFAQAKKPKNPELREKFERWDRIFMGLVDKEANAAMTPDMTFEQIVYAHQDKLEAAHKRLPRYAIASAVDSARKRKLPESLRLQDWIKRAAEARWQKRLEEAKAWAVEESKRQGVAGDLRDEIGRLFDEVERVTRNGDKEAKDAASVYEEVEKRRGKDDPVTKIVRKARKDFLVTQWQTLSGWKVRHQGRMKPADKRAVEYTPPGRPTSKRLTLTLTEEWGPHKEAFRKAAAPNFVHSLDAAHAALTIMKVTREQQDVHSFALVHDCVGTHAGHVETLRNCLREAFAEMYAKNGPARQMLDKFAEDCGVDQFKRDSREPELDVRDVLRSPYFFD